MTVGYGSGRKLDGRLVEAEQKGCREATEVKGERMDYGFEQPGVDNVGNEHSVMPKDFTPMKVAHVNPLRDPTHLMVT